MFVRGVLILADFPIYVSRFLVVHQVHTYGIDINAEHQYVVGKADGVLECFASKFGFGELI